MELTLDQVLQQGISAHKEGNLQHAERCYRAVLDAQPSHPDANHNLGVLATSVGKAAEALNFLRKALKANPGIEQFWLSYIDALLLAESVEELEAVLVDASKAGVSADKLDPFYRQLVQAPAALKQQAKVGSTLSEKRKRLAEKKNEKRRKAQRTALNNLPLEEQTARVQNYYTSGRLDEAETLATSLTQNFPQYHAGWLALGAVCRETGRLKESLEALSVAVSLAPSDAMSHHNLGVVLQELDRLNEAEEAYRRATELKPDYALAFCNLGKTLHRLDRLHDAVFAYAKAISLQEDYAEAHKHLGRTLSVMGRQNLSFQSSHPSLYPVLVELLSAGDFVRPVSIAPQLVSLLKNDPLIVNLLAKAAEPLGLAQATALIEELNCLPLVHTIMRVTPLPDLAFEAAFIAIRKAVLREKNQIEDGSGIIDFFSTLALHCFINEYVYFESDTETRLVRDLELEVSNVLARAERPKLLDLLLLAVYRPLHLYDWFEQVDVLDQHPELKKRLIEEPLIEREIRKEVTVLNDITDEISRKVRAQYEASPYPRWLKCSKPREPISIEKLCELHELRADAGIITQSAAPEILVAGCGTGQHSIESAWSFRGCEVTAVDISIASLGYAQRKTNELGITNLNYLQADILDLTKLDRQFDVIESVGVLHHMADPMAGWRTLTAILKPGGLIRIGLYSEIARAPMVAVREEISAAGIGSSDSEIRQFRQSIIESGETKYQWLMQFKDFYSLSEMRDLVFHVQEHRFSLPQIQRCLENLELEFCGFELGSVIKSFRDHHGASSDIYDLALWHEFEKQHPNVFTGMYQFWCQKKI